jgi:hypothetical protein
MLKTFKRHVTACALFILLPLLALCGCGYTIVQDKGIMGGQVVNLDVPVFKNKSYEPLVPEFFTESFTRELVTSGLFEINKGNTDSVLVGTITNVRTIPATLSKDGIAIEKTVFVDVSLLLNKKDGAFIKHWAMADAETYRCEPINFEDFNKRAALTRVAARLARRFSALLLTDIDKR